MGLRGDEFGLVWDTPTAIKSAGVSLGPSPTAIAKLRSDWTPPATLPSLRGVRRLAIDIETRDEGLSEYGPGVRRDKDAKIVGIAIGTDDGRRAYLPMRHEGGDNLDPDLVMRWARNELNDYEGELVGGNIIYDLDWLAKDGVTFPKVRVFHDIQVAEPLLDEWRFSYSVDSIARDYLGEGKVQGLLEEAATAYGFGQTEKSIKTNLWRLPARFVGAYAEGDVDLPLRIIALQLKKLEDEGMSHVYEMERKLIPILLAMRQRGVKVDIEKTQQVRAKLVKVRDELIAKACHLAGTKKLELKAPATFVNALRARGLQIPLTAKTKQPSITKAFMEKHQSDELVATIMQGRKVDTSINTFMDGHILGHHVNGRIHCEFHQLKGEDGGTIARFSSSNPNLQNIPSRDEEWAPLIRSIFVPDTEEWVRLDESQVEYRLLTHFARGQGAEEAREMYRTNHKTDFHKMLANMLGADPEDGFKRKRIKNVNFAKVYGAGVAKFAETWGCSIAEAQAFIDEYDAKLPFVKTTYDAAMSWANKRGFVVTCYDRKQRFPMFEPFGNYGDKAVNPVMGREAAVAKWGPRVKRAWTYMALSRKLQGSGAEIMKKAMVDAWEAGVQNELGAFLLTVHDELDVDNPKTKASEQAIKELQYHMEHCFELKVPLFAEIERGSNWGSAS